MTFLSDYPQLKDIQDIARKEKVSVYLVGGFLRDYLLHNQKNDFDFAVERNALKVARRFSRKIKGAYVLLDEDRGCARVAKKKNGELFTFDFADYRAKTIKGDLGQRDFTINTLSLNLFALKEDTVVNDVLLDHKSGLKDIKAGRIRRTSVKAFKDDPLRMLRAFSLHAQLGFKIEKQTLSQIKKERDLIRAVSPERVRDELFKILESSRCAQTIKAMDTVGILEKVIPQVRVMYGCHQGRYHHLDVWKHSLETVVQLDKVLEKEETDSDVGEYLDAPLAGNRTRKGLMRLAALLHDVGKPDTRRREGGKYSFHGHEHVGKVIVRIVAKNLKLATRERHILEEMVRWHLRPGYLSNFSKPTERAFYRYFRDTKEEAVSIALLSLADQRATRGPLTTQKDQRHHEKICRELIKRYFEKAKEKPFVRLINGLDLMKKFKLKPSPLIGKVLAEIDEKQNLGKVKTKKEALELAEKVVNRIKGLKG